MKRERGRRKAGTEVPTKADKQQGTASDERQGGGADERVIVAKRRKERETREKKEQWRSARTSGVCFHRGRGEGTRVVVAGGRHT